MCVIVILYIFVTILKSSIMNDSLPINVVDNCASISPKGIITLAISEMRKSECSDEDIAAYACNILSAIMIKNNFIIEDKGLRIAFEKR